MKKLFTFLFLSAALLVGCQNENSVNPRPTDQIISKVTITGRVRADLVNTNAILENAPDGLKIVAEISTRDLVLNPTSANYPPKYYEATVSGGQYSIEVEAGPYGSDVEIYFPDFRADVQTATTPISTLFSGSSRSTNVIKGQGAIVDFNY